MKFFPGVEIPPFFGECGDEQHGVPHAQVVFGYAAEGLVPVSARQCRQAWIVNVIDVDKRPNDAEQRPDRNVLVDQGYSKCPCK